MADKPRYTNGGVNSIHDGLRWGFLIVKDSNFAGCLAEALSDSATKIRMARQKKGRVQTIILAVGRCKPLLISCLVSKGGLEALAAAGKLDDSARR